MKTLLAGCAAALAWSLCVLPLPAQVAPAGDPVVKVEYTNSNLVPAYWMLLLHSDGSSHFHSARGNDPSPNHHASGSPIIAAPDLDRDVQLSAQFTSRVFLLARSGKWARDCESHRKVAFQGWKKLSYSGPEGQGACEFNYSDDKETQAVGEALVAAANTIIEGARLEMLLQHDRLGLDQELEYLTEAQHDGRLQQFGAIRAILSRLADDPAVMDRVRKRAKSLLEKAEE